jgi:ribosomal protein S12 methylthiotransferase
MLPEPCARSAVRASWPLRKRGSIRKLRERVGATMQVLVDSAPGLGRKGGVGRSYADAPEIDGIVHLLPPEKISKTLKVGAFTRARIVGTQGHDLVALPV